jgi:ABC-2 type transport system permease protein
MIFTLLRVSWINLKRDRVAQAMTFLLPVLFFSIFALVFGNQGSTSTTKIRIAVVDEDGSEFSKRIVQGLLNETALRVRTTVDPEGKGAPLDRESGRALVKSGDVPVAVVLQKGLGSSAASFGQSAGRSRCS